MTQVRSKTLKLTWTSQICSTSSDCSAAWLVARLQLGPSSNGKARVIADTTLKKLHSTARLPLRPAYSISTKYAVGLRTFFLMLSGFITPPCAHAGNRGSVSRQTKSYGTSTNSVIASCNCVHEVVSKAPASAEALQAAAA